ncbi:MAG: PIN domain-containing protein [Anaerolineales bacterium]|nr:PIN domain-containing protein [Anaerolineales bacterium]
MRIFADSGFWLAVYAANDKYSKVAQATFRSLAGQRVTFFVTDYIFDETLTLLMTRLGHSYARQWWGEWLLTDNHVRFIRIDPEQWNDAWELFKRYDDRGFSFTDCTSFVVMRQLKLRDVFTFDQHFKQMGFRLWPQI